MHTKRQFVFQIWGVYAKFNEVMGPFGAPAHTAHVIENWLRSNRSDFIEKEESLPNSPDLNLYDCHVWGQCWKIIIVAAKAQNSSQVKDAQSPINSSAWMAAL